MPVRHSRSGRHRQTPPVAPVRCDRTQESGPPLPLPRSSATCVPTSASTSRVVSGTVTGYPTVISPRSSLDTLDADRTLAGQRDFHAIALPYALEQAFVA